MEPTPENLKAFRHAQWRVKFTSYLLALHEGVANKGTLSWIQQQADFINRHALAKESLVAFPKAWHDLFAAPEVQAPPQPQDGSFGPT